MILHVSNKFMLYHVEQCSQPVGRGQLSMGLQSSRFDTFYCKTVKFYYNTALGFIKYVDLKVKRTKKLSLVGRKNFII